MWKPQQAVLTIWRLLLVLAAVPPAFLISLLFQAGGLPWLLLVAAWLLAFLFFYLLYLPLRYRKLAFQLQKDRIIVHSGIFYTRIRAMPLQSIQYVGLLISPLDALFGLSALVITAPGGRIVIPGLRRRDAENLAELLP